MANGFATRKAPEASKEAKNSSKRWNLTAYDKVPKALVQTPAPPSDEPDYAAQRAHNLRRMQVLQFA